MQSINAKDIDEYIARFPKNVQVALEEVRKTIKQAAPGAEETISYAIPAFKQNGQYLVYFAGYQHHIGLYPAPVGNPIFEKAFSKYKTGKGSVQFPLDKPMPIALITRIVKFRIAQNKEKAKNVVVKSKRKA